MSFVLLIYTTVFFWDLWSSLLPLHWGLPWWLSGKESTCNAGDLGSMPGWGRSPGEGNGNPLQYSCLEIPWTEEPGGPQSMGCRVRHDWALWPQQDNLGSGIDSAVSSLCRLNWLHCSEPQFPHPENGHGNICLSNWSESEKEHMLNTLPQLFLWVFLWKGV